MYMYFNMKLYKEIFYSNSFRMVKSLCKKIINLKEVENIKKIVLYFRVIGKKVN